MVMVGLWMTFPPRNSPQSLRLPDLVCDCFSQPSQGPLESGVTGDFRPC